MCDRLQLSPSHSVTLSNGVSVENEKDDLMADARAREAGFWQEHGPRLVGLFFWLVLLALYVWYVRANDLTVRDSLSRLARLLIDSFYGPLFYIVVYALRPLIFFPATLLTVLSGFLFGPLAILYTVLGSNASAMVAYSVGRYFGRGILEAEEDVGRIRNYMSRMRDNSFETVLLMRLIFLPYDLVNYAAGFLKIDWKAFLLATIIGSIPGTISFVLLGNSFGTLDELLAGQFRLNPVALGLSVILILVSIGLSRYLRRHEVPQEE